MSYFQRLVAQSRAAPVSRPAVDSVRPAAGAADIVEIVAEPDASAPAAPAMSDATARGRPVDATPTIASGREAVSSVDRSGAPVVGSGDPRDATDNGARVDDPAATDATAAASVGTAPRSTPDEAAVAPQSIAGVRDADPDRDRPIDDAAASAPRGGADESPAHAPATAPDPRAAPVRRALDPTARSSTVPAGMARAETASAASDGPTLSADMTAHDLAAAPRRDRTIGATAPPPSSSGRIEVRFGRVSVEVHAAPPTPPAPIAAPVVQIVAPAAAPAFAPSRHYLRMD